MDDEQHEPSSQPTPFSPTSGRVGVVLDDDAMSVVNEKDGNGWFTDIPDVHDSLNAGYGGVPMCIKGTFYGINSGSRLVHDCGKSTHVIVKKVDIDNCYTAMPRVMVWKTLQWCRDR